MTFDASPAASSRSPPAAVREVHGNLRRLTAPSMADLVSVSTGPRALLSRAGVGAAGLIVQRADLTTRRVLVDQPTLILVEHGTKRIRWSGGECVARPGDGIAVQGGELVDISNTPGPSGSYTARWLVWSDELLEGTPLPARRPSRRVVTHRALPVAFVESYRRACDALDASDLPASIATSRVREPLLWLAERGFHFDRPTTLSLTVRVRRLLSTDPAAEWPMEKVAKATATSVPTLRRRLADEGMVFRDVLQDVRMLHALTLLQNTDASVLQVSISVGYTSSSRFAARFRARFGYLPTDVRGQRRSRNHSSAS